MVNLPDNKNILIVGEFPVIHKGYLNFFNKILRDSPKAHFYLGFLDNKIIRELTKLEPDIRKIPMPEIKKVIKVYLPIKKFFLLTKTNFSQIIKEINPSSIIVLKGDKSEDFAEHYLDDKKYKNIVLRYDVRLKWQNKKVFEFKKESSVVSKKQLAGFKKFMKEALKEAEKSQCWWRQVGAVLVKDKKIILSGFNEMLPYNDECYKIGCIRDKIQIGKLQEICSVIHSEAAIIAEAARKGISLENTTMYVTHFPCPVCAKLIALSGIKKLIYSKGSSVFDGERVMKSKGVEIIKIPC